MTVHELVQRFPEIPVDLRDDPLVARMAERCGELLAVARKPSACSEQQDAPNQYYLKLIGPLSIYGYGLSTREKVQAQLQEILDRQAADPEGFPTSLLPSGTAEREVKGPGCE